MENNYKQIVEAVSSVTNFLMSGVYVRATKYISPKLIVRATRRRFQGTFRKGENLDIILTIGRPNYIEREFIKLCQKANEPFPVKNIQLKLYNPIKKKLVRKYRKRIYESIQPQGRKDY